MPDFTQVHSPGWLEYFAGTKVAVDLGHEPEVLLIIQAAYAVASSNAFTADGSDGHFSWCIAQLRRGEFLRALGI